MDCIWLIDFIHVTFKLHTDYIRITYGLHTVYILHMYNIYTIQPEENHECLQSNYWQVPHFKAQVLTFHHLQPSALFFCVSQEAPGKVLPSLRMEYGCVPVFPTGTTGILPRTNVIGWRTSTALETAIYTHKWWLIHIAPARLDKNIA